MPSYAHSLVGVRVLETISDSLKTYKQHPDPKVAAMASQMVAWGANLTVRFRVPDSKMPSVREPDFCFGLGSENPAFALDVTYKGDHRPSASQFVMYGGFSAALSVKLAYPIKDDLTANHKALTDVCAKSHVSLWATVGNHTEVVMDRVPLLSAFTATAEEKEAPGIQLYLSDFMSDIRDLPCEFVRPSLG